MVDITINEVMSRMSSAFFLGKSHKGKRNLYDSFGYNVDVKHKELYEMYKRNDIANRIISAFPQATWRVEPTIEDDDGDTDDTSQFVKEANDFLREHKIYHYLERLDRLSGIGAYAILVLGFDDGNSLDKPLLDGDHNLMYVQPYMESSAEITEFVSDPSNPRFELPEYYTINPENNNRSRTSVTKKTHRVHHSRVIHVSEFLDEDDVYGVPKLLPVYNRLKDLEKVVGGSSEMFWLNGRGGMMLSADKESKFSEADKELMKKQAQEYEHEMRRMLIGKGMTMTPISIQVPDPKPNVDTLLDLISGTVLIPKRILTGSERGELASSQDENNFAARVDERRRNFAVPVILREFIERMIETGNIPQPAGGEEGMFDIYWETDDGLSQLQKAEIATKKTAALVSYSNSSADRVMPVGEFREKILELPVDIDYEAYEIELREEEMDNDLFEEGEDDQQEPINEGEEEGKDKEGKDKEAEKDASGKETEAPFQNFKKLSFMKVA